MKWMREKHRRGETILETVIAMGVVVVGITMASTIMGTSIRDINSSKNRVVAVNIAKEGLEAIRNIRDTNWLKFSGNKRDCWNHDPATDTCADANEAISPGQYIAYKQPINPNNVRTGWKWRLENVRENVSEVTVIPPVGNRYEVFMISEDGNPCASDGTEDKCKAYLSTGTEWVDWTQLSIVDIDPLDDSDGDDLYENDPDTYNHALVTGAEKALGESLAKKTVFRRQITITYLADDGSMGDASSNRMVIRSKVTWNEGKNEFSTDLSTHLSDHLGRERIN